VASHTRTCRRCRAARRKGEFECDDALRTSGGGRWVRRPPIERLALATLLVATSVVVVTATTESRSAATAEPARGRHRNSSPGTVKIDIEAREAEVSLVPGNTTRVWAYNGTVPGPTITAERGDDVVVNLTNRLPEPTTIHWHGVELPATMDGSHISQEPVAPGGTFQYRFKPLTAATYWYHSHVNSAVQVEQGLYGALVVRDQARDRKLGLPEDEMTLIVDDILLDDSGQLTPFATDPAATLAPRQRALQLADGREGNHLLVNGRVLPTVDVTAGRPQRWRIVNVANGRFLRLSIPGQTMYRIGGDAGLIEYPEKVQPVAMLPDPADPKRRISDANPDNGLLLVPGERAEVVITPRGQPGEEITVEWHDFPRGRHDVEETPEGLAYGHNFNDGKGDPQPLMRLRIANTTKTNREYVPPRPLVPVAPLDVAGVPAIPIPFGHAEPDTNGNAAFFSARRGDTPITFQDMTSAEAPDVEVGKTYILEVTNTTKMDHPVHVHGFFFQPLETEYVDPTNPDNNRVVPFLGRENKDTIRLPAAPGAHEGAGGKAILRLAIRFNDTGRKGQVEASGMMPSKGRSGGWMLHCHNQEHAEAGMMTFLELRTPRPPGSSSRSSSPR
jgi:FtsP/CotA-like multicopper oxidase with cupredoxin domain